MNRKIFGMMLTTAMLMFTLLACDIASGIPGLSGLPGMGGAQAMWSDVPAFEGATQDAKEALGAGIFNQAQADQKSKMETLLYRTSKQPADVAAFYNDDRMKSFGWSPQGLGNAKSGCYQDLYEGQPRAICQFSKKNEEGRAIELMIDARIDPQVKNTRLTFVRITGSVISSSTVPTMVAQPTQPVAPTQPRPTLVANTATPTPLTSAIKLPADPTSVAVSNLDGEWQGTNSANTPVQFTVKNNQVTYINPNYAVKSGTCQLSGGFSRSVNAPIADKNFSVTVTEEDGKQVVFNGKFISDAEAIGTLRIKAPQSFCGSVEGEMTWSAKNSAAIVVTAPTATRTAPTSAATRSAAPTLAMPDGPDATIVRNFFNAINAKNLDGALALVTDNVIYNFGTTTGFGKANLRAHLSSQIQAGVTYQLSNVKTNPAAVTFGAQAGATSYAQGQAMFTDGKIVILKLQ